ncbi:MAG: GDSL-type esterase/lipase family protein [Verrucomicrobiota bacterium]
MKRVAPFFLMLGWLAGFSIDGTAAAPVMRIMALGDSITQGYGIPIEGGYRTRLYQLLTGAGYTVDFVGTQVIGSNNSSLPDPQHEGYGGFNIAYLDARIDVAFGSVDDPDVILLLIGTNDFAGNDSVETAIDRYENLIAHIASLRPHARIFVSNLLKRTDSTPANPDANNDIETLFNPYVPGVVDHQVSLGKFVSFVDLHDAFGPCCGNDPSVYLADGLHPSLTGYNAIADTWFSAIQTVMTVNGTATNAPAIARVAGQVDHCNHVVVTFSKPVEDAATVGNYGLSGGLNVLGAELDPSKRMVTLTTSQQAPGTSYTVTVNGWDRINPPHTIAANSTGGFTSKAVTKR